MPPKSVCSAKSCRSWGGSTKSSASASSKKRARDEITEKAWDIKGMKATGHAVNLSKGYANFSLKDCEALGIDWDKFVRLSGASKKYKNW